jgi:tetratricopeptide (TPR) repeat protein
MRLGRKAILGGLVCFTLAGTLRAQPPAGVKPPTSAPTARSKASLEPLLQQGSDALAAGQYRAAREAFLDAIVIDPRNVKATHGLALCLVEEKQVAKAAAMLDKALTFTTKPDRALVLNAAAANMAIRSHMRAAKLARDYLTAHPKEADEAVLNALGTALSSATATERKNRFFTDAAAFYMIANQRLEASRPGYKRFGADWYPAHEAEAKERALAAEQKKLDSLSDVVARAEDRLARAEREYERQRNMIAQRIELPGNYYMAQAETAYDAARSNLELAQEKYDTLANSLSRPKFPPEIQMVSIDQTKTPAVSTAVAVASADPPVVIKPKPVEVKPRPKPTEPPEKVAVTPKPVVKTPEPLALEPPRPQTPRKVRITQYAAAFPVASDLVVTSAQTVKDATALQLQMLDGQSIPAELVRKDDASGLALLRVTSKKFNPLPLADTFAGGAVTCASFPTVDLFSPAAQSINGSAAAPKEGWTISLNVHPRLAGAPILSGGKVVGVCVAPREAEKMKLPAATLEQLKAFVGNDAGEPKFAADPAQSLLQLVTTRETSGE